MSEIVMSTKIISIEVSFAKRANLNDNLIFYAWYKSVKNMIIVIKVLEC